MERGSKSCFSLIVGRRDPFTIDTKLTPSPIWCHPRSTSTRVNRTPGCHSSYIWTQKQGSTACDYNGVTTTALNGSISPTRLSLTVNIRNIRYPPKYLDIEYLAVNWYNFYNMTSPWGYGWSGANNFRGWQKVTTRLTGVARSSIRLRFVFWSDASTEYDGIGSKFRRNFTEISLNIQSMISPSRKDPVSTRYPSVRCYSHPSTLRWSNPMSLSPGKSTFPALEFPRDSS